jgi:hypothetical protein
MKRAILLAALTLLATPAAAATTFDLFGTRAEETRGIPADWRLHFAEAATPTSPAITTAPAQTQVTTTTKVQSETAIAADQVTTILMPILLAIASAAALVITTLATLAVNWIRKKSGLTDAEAESLGLKIDAQRSAALQTALTNAAGLALNKLGNELKGKVIEVHNPAIKEAVDMVLRSAPDAIAYFDLTDKPVILAQKIIAKLPQIANTTTTADDAIQAAAKI